MIKNCLLFLIILTLIVNPLILYSEENQDINLYEKGKEDGKKAVSFIDFPLWIVLGATSSCLLLIPNALFFTILLGSTPSPFFSSGVGCLIPLIITYLFDPCIPYNMLYTMLDTKKEKDYIKGFIEGYTTEVKKKRLTGLFIGGALMILFLFSSFFTLVNITRS